MSHNLELPIEGEIKEREHFYLKKACPAFDYHNRGTLLSSSQVGIKGSGEGWDMCRRRTSRFFYYWGMVKTN